MGDKTLKSTNRRWLSTAVATVGAGVLTFGGAVLPAAAAETPDEPVTLTASADKYELAAARTGEVAGDLAQDEAAGLISVTDKGFVYFVDDAHSDHGLSTLNLPVAEGAPIPNNPAEGSRPGAPVTVYLDFDGETLENTQWNNYSGIASLPFAPAAGVNAAEVWAAVAEDYAPFNVNVTTTRPSDEALYKTSAADNEYGSHVIITDSYDEVLPAAAGTGGIAWLGGTGSDFLTGALVFTEGTEGASKPIAEIASHESGHNFGLGHDGIAGADGEYYVPTEGVWGTIMGAAYVVPVSQWSAGAYAGATNTEDDLSVITDRAAAEAIFVGATTSDGQAYAGAVCVESGNPQNPQPGDVFYAVGPNGDCNPLGEQLTLNFSYTDRADFAADAIGNTAAEAQALDNASGSFEAAGVIEQTADVDVFTVTTVGGELTAAVEVADISPNLDAKLTVTDSAGALVAENDPAATRDSESAASGLSASVAADVPAGTYFITVDGVGSGDPNTATPANANGYTDYGSLGNYSLSGTAEPFVTEAIVISTPADGAAVTGGSEVEVTGTATPDATVVLTIAGTAVDTVTADENGNWAGAVTVNEYGTTEIVAAQSIGGIAIPGTDSVTVTAPPAPLAAPVITAPAGGSTTEDGTPTISGTGVAGATVTVTVTDASGNAVYGEAVVAADGTWTLDLGTELANGEYTVIATQSANGVASEDSAAVAFTVAVPGGNGGNGDNGDGDLATTGSDFNAMPFAAMGAILLLTGGGIAAYARRKSLSLDS